MTFTSKHTALVGGLFLLTVTGTAQAAQFIVNGRFNHPNVGHGVIESTAIPGWENLADPGGVEIGYTPIYGLPCISKGCHNMEVNAFTFGDVVQTVKHLTVGQIYKLSFDYGGRPGFGKQKLDIYFGGKLLAQDTGDLGSWDFNSFVIKATAKSEVLRFESLNVGGAPTGGNEITNVRLTGPDGVPEPASWAMMLTGFALTGAALRRRAAPLRVRFG